MRKTMGESGAVIGADWSGRFYFRMADGCESALLAVAHVIGLLNATGRRLGELAQGVVKLRSSGEVICPCPSPEIAVRRLVEQFPGATVAEIDGVTIRYEDWWFNARPIMGDKMGVVVEARSKKVAEERLAEIAAMLS